MNDTLRKLIEMGDASVADYVRLIKEQQQKQQASQFNNHLGSSAGARGDILIKTGDAHWLKQQNYAKQQALRAAQQQTPKTFWGPVSGGPVYDPHNDHVSWSEVYGEDLTGIKTNSNKKVLPEAKIIPPDYYSLDNIPKDGTIVIGRYETGEVRIKYDTFRKQEIGIDVTYNASGPGFERVDNGIGVPDPIEWRKDV